MTKMLEDAVSQVSSLPAAEQDCVTQLLTDELASEKRWDDLVAGSQDALEQMALEALAQHRAELTQPREDLLNEVEYDRVVAALNRQ